MQDGPAGVLGGAIRKLRLRKPLALFSTVPAAISLAFLALAGALTWADLVFTPGTALPEAMIPPPALARTFFTALATAAITVLSLTYSITLVVFTLAAGTIGPRLLQRFTSEPAIQVTAGIFGGSFLYAMAGILALTPDRTPVLTLAGAGLLAVIAVGQLVFFVRHVADSVSVDNEIADIGRSLSRDMEALLDRAGAQPGDWDDPSEVLNVLEDGYVGQIDEGGLVALAAERDLRLRLSVPPGSFVLEGAPLVEIIGASDALDDADRDRIRASVSIEVSRGQEQNVQFSINLLIEIGLRALSPGVNDTFTAMTCVDRLAAALRLVVRENTDARFRTDEDGTARLEIPGLSTSGLVRTSFGPFRRATSGNILMAAHLARTLRDLACVAAEEVRPIIEKEAGRLAEAVRTQDLLEDDLRLVDRRLGDLAGARGRGKDAKAPQS